MLNFKSYELIAKLYKKYGQNFINHLKGSFIILLVVDDKIILYNDIHSLEKYFIRNSGGKLIISSNVLLMNTVHRLELDPLYPAVLALFQHPVSGLTMFRDLSYSEYATEFTFDGEVKIKKYWSPEKLIEAGRDKYSMNDLIDLFRNIIGDYIDFFRPETVSLTLTGGRDTRSVLAALLYLNIIPHSFTFGNPYGTDVITAKNICSNLNLPFSNHYIKDIDEKIYESLINGILFFGDPLVSLHRAHRLDAIKKEHEEKEKSDMLFVGAMGGDFIKGVSFNDYIVTEFIRSYLFSKKDTKSLIKEILSKHYVKYDENILNKLTELTISLKFLNRQDFKRSEFLLAHSFIGALHDSQDLFIFSRYFNHVVSPFLDIDFFEALFQSRFSLFDNFRSSKNPLLKIKGGEFQANLIKCLFKPLAYLPMANNYKPIDLLRSKYIYALKRFYLRIKHPGTVPTFSYDNWFQKYIKSAYLTLSSEIHSFYNLDKLIYEVNNSNHQTTEGYWHKYSNPVIISKWLEIIKSNNLCWQQYYKMISILVIKTGRRLVRNSILIIM